MRPARLWAKLAMRSLFVLLLLGWLLQSVGRLDRIETLVISDIQHRQGHSFVLTLPGFNWWTKLLYRTASDTSEHPIQSRLSVLENGTLLPAPHSVHIDIDNIGLGRYSHWGGSLLFSTTDNSDPRTNARLYQILWRASALPFIVSLVGFFSALVCWLLFYRRKPLRSIAEVGVALRVGGSATRALRRILRGWHWLIRALLVCFVLSAALEPFLALERTITFTASDIQARSGHSYLLHFATRNDAHWWPYDLTSDSDRFGGSRLILLENGKMLRPHAQHQEIADYGEGRYSHWGDSVVFSASDNTDPRTNGYVYAIVVQPHFLKLYVVLWLLIAGALIARKLFAPEVLLRDIEIANAYLASGRLWVGVSVAFSLYIISSYSFGSPNLPMVQGDFMTYWRGLSAVPPGYPAFLRGTFALLGSYKAIAVVQIVLFCIAVVVLQLALLKATGSVIASAAIALLLLGTPELRESAQSLLSESLFISLLILHCAAAALVFATRCRRACILLAVTAAAMVSVRPAGYFVVGSILLLPIFWSGARRHVLIWACVPLVVTMGLITIADRLVRGVGGSSNAGYALLPHVAYLNKPNSGYLPPDADSAVMSYVLPYQALRSSGVPWHELQVIEANNFNPLMHSVQDQFRDERAARSAALRLIRSDPFGYVEIVAMNLYMGLWAYTLINVPDHGRLLQQRYATDLVNMQAQYPSIGQSVDGQYLTDERNHFILRDDYWMPTLILSTTERNGVLIIYLAAALFSVVRFFRFHRLPPTVKLSAYLAVASLGGYLLVALSTVFILRYGVPLGALVLIVVVLELLNLSRWLRVRSGQIRSVDLLEHVVRGALQQAR